MPSKSVSSCMLGSWPRTSEDKALKAQLCGAELRAELGARVPALRRHAARHAGDRWGLPRQGAPPALCCALPGHDVCEPE
eukprot:3651734-Rhodomonas_salina.1